MSRLPFTLASILSIAPLTGAAITLDKNPGIAFSTPVKATSLDPEVFAEWFDGAEKKIVPSEKDKNKNTPQSLLITDSTTPGAAAYSFGDSKSPGPRHLRIGLKEPVPVGTILTKHGGAVSVLKPGAPYPGDLSNNDHWTPAQRYEKNGQPTSAELTDENLALWVLPPGTTTRAIRFTHTAKLTDTKYEGTLAGAMILPDRIINEAWTAIAGASANNQNAKRINNLNEDGWQAWENVEKGKSPEDAPVISASHPEFITLTWAKPVTIDGLIAIWAGIADAEVQTYTGSENKNPKDAAETDWKTIHTYDGLKHNYAAQFWPNRLAFGKEIKTRALRLRITAPGANLSHANNNGGKRIWLGELMATRSIDSEPLKPIESSEIAAIPKPPIPIKFTLKEPGYVSLVIEKPDGFRVRNLISETHFPAGENIAWWDGTDDLGRDADAADHGVYNIPVHFIEPGAYRVRGIVRGAIQPHYEFSVYTTGNPPWSTEDNTGAWLANHSPPQAAAFIPAAQSPTGEDVVYLGCYVTEGPSGLAWVDLTGKKLGGKKWIGGNWTAAPFLARDAGDKPTPDTHVYVGSVWQTAKGSGIGELRITALTKAGDKDIIKHIIGDIPIANKAEDGAGSQLGGIAVRNGIVIVALTKKNTLLIIDSASGKVTGSAPVDAPQGIAFDAKGGLLVLSGTKLLRFDSIEKLADPQTLVSTNLEAPKGITLDENGAIFISDWGNSHQVKIFTAGGKFVSAIGKPGAPTAGKYDPLHMNHPQGIAVDSKQQLWVTEHDYMPKRVSVWSADGKLVKAFYGPGKYGGGGALDPQDKTKFYYADEGRGSLEFKLDWTKGTWDLERVLFRKTEGDMELATRSGAPEQAIYYEGRRYFTNTYNSSPTGGHPTAWIFAERNGITVPAAGFGNAMRWEILKTDEFKSRWPAATDPNAKKEPDAFFIWSDINEDAHVQPEEVAIQNTKSGGITVMPDLSFCATRVDGKALEYQPTGFTKSGVPFYDFAKSKVLAENVQNPKSSGGDQALAGTDGWSVVTLGIGSFDGLSISGAKNGVAKWSYPSLWPGLHASHRAPRPSLPGQLIGTTRLPGGFFEIKGTDTGPLWALHTNHGRLAIFTQDGIFVAHLFEDMRTGKSWKMPTEVRDTDLEGLSLGEENFWPTLTHSSDGKVYLVDGARSAIVRLDGMDTLRRLPDSDLNITAADIEKSRAWRLDAEAARQLAHGTGVLKVALRSDKPVVDGKLTEWATADWVDIDKSGVKAYFNANTKPYDITGTVAVAGDKLYAAWKTGDENSLKNSGEMPVAPFKTGGALDLMIGPAGDRKNPIAGDMRLLVTVVKNKPLALLYRAIVPGTPPADKVPFSSPARTITFDKVEDVSSLIEFSGSEGNYEISIPLTALGFKPTAGARIRGDIGILRGDGTETNARVYWSNKATGITSDVPDEAMLSPNLWGTFEFR